MDYNKLFQSKTFKIILWSVAGLIIFLVGLKLGIFIGFKKANFSYKWAENYHRNFAGPRRGFFEEFSDRDFIDSHGVFGQIIAINDSTIVVRGRADMEKIVLVKEDTIIKKFRDSIKFTELKVDDSVVVIGEPNNEGQIEAKFIRVLPSPPTPFLFKKGAFWPEKEKKGVF